MPANAASCSGSETEVIRSLLVPITRVSAHQGRNLEENRDVLVTIRKLTENSKSLSLKRALRDLKLVIQKGQLHPGSTYYWGYREGSAWKTFKIALVLTQKGLC